MDMNVCVYNDDTSTGELIDQILRWVNQNGFHSYHIDNVRKAYADDWFPNPEEDPDDNIVDALCSAINMQLPNGYLVAPLRDPSTHTNYRRIIRI